MVYVARSFNKLVSKKGLWLNERYRGKKKWFTEATVTSSQIKVLPAVLRDCIIIQEANNDISSSLAVN